jgi:glycosyltransferase involved in cell wall biosynthesis
LRERAIALGASADRIETVAYGVDADRFRPDAEARARCRAGLGIANDDPVLFTAGRFVRKKGFEDLLDATAVLASTWPSLVCVIGGGGDLERELRARAALLGLGAHVRFVGVLAHGEVADHLSAADIAVVPSVRDSTGNVDGLPNIVMEALASATPLVATAVGGIPAVVRSGETAMLVPQHDSRSLAQALDHLLRSPEVRQRMGAAARDEVLRLRGWDRTIDRFEAAYEEARRGRRTSTAAQP